MSSWYRRCQSPIQGRQGLLSPYLVIVHRVLLGEEGDYQYRVCSAASAAAELQPIRTVKASKKGNGWLQLLLHLPAEQAHKYKVPCGREGIKLQAIARAISRYNSEEAEALVVECRSSLSNAIVVVRMGPAHRPTLVTSIIDNPHC